MIELTDIQKTKSELEKIRDSVVKAEATKKATFQNIIDSIKNVLDYIPSEKKEEFVILFPQVVTADEDGKMSFQDCGVDDIQKVIEWVEKVELEIREEIEKGYAEVQKIVAEWKELMSGGAENV